MKHLFIINPAAGKGKTLKLIPLIHKILKDKGEEYIIEITKGEGHATQIAREYCLKEDYIIYSVGGDGTLNEVLNGMIDSGSSLAVVPAGSGNDFIKSIYNYKKGESTENILINTLKGEEKFIDLCRFNDRYFINIASVGFDADVAYNAIKFKKLPFIGGTAAYILSILITVFKNKSYRLEIMIDDKKISEDTLFTAVANGRYYGGGVNITPKAEIDDGLFTICLVKKVAKLKILRLFPRVIKGTHADIEEVSFYEGKKVKIKSGVGLHFNIDGEISEGKYAEFEIIRKGIKVIIPR